MSNSEQAYVSYLRGVADKEGAQHLGVFLSQNTGLFDTPGGGWQVLMLAGVVFLCFATAPCLSPELLLALKLETRVAAGQAVATAAGVFLILWGVVRFRQPCPRVGDGSFLFADGAYFWEVGPRLVRAFPLADLISVNGSHSIKDGWYCGSNLELVFRQGHYPFLVHSKLLAERMVQFLHLILQFRSSDDLEVRNMASSDPAQAAALALHLIDNDGRGLELSQALCPKPPAPPLTYADISEPGRPSWGWRIPAFAAALFGLLSYLLFLYVNPIVLDDHRFLFAVRSAEENDSPAALRDYLTNPKAQRHRNDARNRIGVYYDRAVKDLKSRALERGKDINRDFFDAALAVLEALKEEDSPVVTVGFQARLDPLPASPEQEMIEKMVYEARISQNPELKEITSNKPNKSAILDTGSTFDPSEAARREKVILDRLSDAVKTAIKQEVLSFKPAPRGQKPNIEVAYHVYPAGGLYLYVETGLFGMEKKTKGLIRGYNIKWTITVRPPGNGGQFVWDLESEALANLTYDRQPGDPAWAPYAVVLYSGFYDMGSRLIENFGLNPGPAPNAFTFEAVARQRSEPEVKNDPNDLLERWRKGVPKVK
ncbi:MAG: hypothetical protein U0840_13475 [Gemmataceae bacterium]